MSLLFLGLATCYDAPRDNPLDPTLTPAVELLNVVVDSTSGSALLEWTPYAGQQPFREYQVLRKVQGLEKEDTLAQITEVQQTSFRDTTPKPGVTYLYWVVVVNQGGFDVESARRAEVVYALPGVELLAAQFSSDTATAQLVWSQYRGPNFVGYEVWRKAPELEEKTVAEMDDVGDTTYADTLLDGNTEYTYHIVVRTGWEGIEVSSNEKSGRFYPFGHEIRLEELPDAEPRAVALAVDEQDQLYVGMTLISAAVTGEFSPRVMEKGMLWFWSGEGVVLQAQTFTEVAASAGVSSSGLGATWGDYDGDGDLDLYATRTGAPNQLFQNNGDGTFTDVAASAGVADPGQGIAVMWGDYDNDGGLDLLLSNFGLDGVSRLYRNNGDRTFTEVGSNAGLNDTGGWRPAAFGDYDNDGDLDIYVVLLSEDINRLYQNNGKGVFTDVATSAGLGDSGSKRVPRWGDYDNDGNLDLFVSGFSSGNRLYRNKGDGTFTDVAVAAGVVDEGRSSGGVAWGDYDNDGLLDLYVTNEESVHRLYQNRGDGTFIEVAASAGVAVTETGHGVNWGDYDNDGDLDLYVATREAKHHLFRNNGDRTFTDVASSLGIDFGPTAFGSDVAWGDYDNDGDLDLYVANIDTPNLLYRNEGTPNRWLNVQLQGTVSNRSAIGARVVAVTGSKRQLWQVEGGMGWCSQNSLAVEFGFGQTAMVDSLIIRWPSGIVQTFTGLETNQRIAIVEDNPLITAVEEEAAALPAAFSLSQNFPNPFNPQTTVHYEVSEEAEIRLIILNLAGQEVRVLVQGLHQPGQYSAVWDGQDAAGRAVASGVYLYRLEAEGRGIIETKRMALVR